MIAGAGVFAALLASTCCVSPLLAIAGALGVGVSQLTFLIELKPYLIGLSLMAIAYNLYRAYQPTVNSCCAVMVEGKREKKPLTAKWLLWSIAFMTILILLLPYVGIAQQNKVVRASDAKIEKVDYHVEKLSQTCCVAIVAYALKKVDGYMRYEVNVEKRQLSVWFDADKTSELQIRQAINKTPYKAVKR